MKPTHVPAILAAACAAAQPMAAHAHHAMGNALPGNVFEGLVSGLAHPVIGLDHFVFVLALGAACYYFGQRLVGIGAFLAAALTGTILHVQQVTLPHAEVWVAASLLLLGCMLLFAMPALKSVAGTLLLATAGIVHGYAYGESIVGAEPTPLAAYLAGFTVIQLCIGLGGFALTRHADRMRRSTAAVRTAGGVASIAGVAFLMMARAG